MSRRPSNLAKTSMDVIDATQEVAIRNNIISTIVTLSLEQLGPEEKYCNKI
jgi:hypothetical protein